MEPSGRNRWQPVANGAAAKVAQTGESAIPGGAARSSQIVMFVREKGLTAILKKARETLEQHPQFVRWKGAAEETNSGPK